MSQIQAFLRRHGALLAIVGIGVLIRLVVLLVYLSTHEWKAETWEAEEVARNILEGKGFTIDSYGTATRSLLDPVFPFLLYLLHLLGGPGFGLYYALQLAMAAGIIYLTYTVAARWLDERTARWAALLVALEPGLVLYQSYKVDDVAPGTLLLLLGIHSFALTTLSHDLRRAAFTGVVIGLGVLTRPNLMGALGMLPLWAFLERRRWRAVSRPAVVMILATAVVWGSWIARNYAVHGKFVLVTTFGGEALWTGNNPLSIGTTETPELKSLILEAPAEFRAKIMGAGEIEQERIFREAALKYIVEQPAAFIRRTVDKFSQFWWFTPTYGARYYGWVPAFFKEVYRLFYIVLMLCGVVGLLTIAKQGTSEAKRLSLFLLAALLSIAAIHSITLVSGRHRVLVMPLFLIFSAHGIVSLRGLLGFSDQPSHPGERTDQKVA